MRELQKVSAKVYGLKLWSQLVIEAAADAIVGL